MRKLLYSKPVLFFLRLFWGIFYKRSYLSGKYFDQKRMGWIWAARDLKGRLFGPNRKIPWPVNPNSKVSNANNIIFDQSSINVFQNFGCYFQCHNASIEIGRFVQIASNVGLITTNHDLLDPAKHIFGKSIRIGDFCWIGMNSMILPGVVLGEHTVVGAGSVVTKSFPDGWVVVAGNPARAIKTLKPKEVAIK